MLKTHILCIYTCYLNYANIAWASTSPNKLKKLFNKQKHAARIISNNNRYTPSRPLMKNHNILNIYQLNIYQTLTFMFKTKHQTSPAIFHKIFKKAIHKYPTNFATNNLLVPQHKLKSSRFCISTRGPVLWNHFLNNEIKNTNSLQYFQNYVKFKLLNNDKELSLF